MNPKGWRKTTFEEIAELITDGEHATPRRVEQGIYLLSARNVLDHELSFETVDYIDQEEYDRISKRLVPRAGDVLISCSGTVGRVCVVPENLKFQMVRSVALVRFKEDINPVFMEQQRNPLRRFPDPARCTAWTGSAAHGSAGFHCRH